MESVDGHTFPAKPKTEGESVEQLTSLPSMC